MRPKSFSSRLFDRSPPTLELPGTSKYQLHVDQQEDGDHQDGGPRPNGRSRGDVHFAFLPERYEPLVEEAQAGAEEEKKKRKKEKYKRVRKNVGKALRSSWKCVMLGLYNLALTYSTPITVASAFIPDFHPSRDGS